MKIHLNFPLKNVKNVCVMLFIVHGKKEKSGLNKIRISRSDFD